MNFTPIIRPLMMRRVEASRRWSAEVEATQRRVLAGLVERGRRTEWGSRHGFDTISCYEDFAGRVPVTPYPAIRAEVMRMVAGERDILWPGRCRWYAQSSGTADGRSKFIPVTDDSLRESHYAGGAEVVAHYLASNPGSRMFAGKNFILGGSFASTLAEVPAGVHVGDLSATLIRRINPLADLVRVPSRRVDRKSVV